MTGQTETQPWQEMLSTEQRKFLMDQLEFDQEAGVFLWRRNGRGQTKRAGAIAGARHSNGYVRIKVAGRTFYAHRLAYLFVAGEWPENEVDHINGDRADNRWLNLRAATVAENRRNCIGQPGRRISKFKGVTREHKSGLWLAKIMLNGKTLRLGHFKCEAEAARAYRNAAKSMHGEFAKW